MRIKIYRGTASSHSESLCDSCRHARITRGRRIDEELVLCGEAHMAPPIPITFKVTSCSSYDDDRVPSYFELMQQAWILQPASSKRGAGFVRASDLRDRDFAAYLAALDDEDDR